MQDPVAARHGIPGSQRGGLMRIHKYTVGFLLLLAVAPSAYGGWQADLARALDMEPGSEQDRLIAAVERAQPEFEEVMAAIRTAEFPPCETKKLVTGSSLCLDGVERPWVLYVPSVYKPGVPTPLLVRLHGGVGRAEIIEDPAGYATEDEWLPVAEAEGWLVLYPFGQAEATWWDRVGMANIRNLIRSVKRDYNIDDDRVWMAGFSDGASAGFAWAMVEPNDLAAVVALNGHLGVGSLDGDLPLYAVNLANTPVYAVTTMEDELYPSEGMRPTIRMALDAGAAMLYRELEGTHDFTYAATELPRIAAFLLRHPRDPLPAKIVWEAGSPEYGRCRWLKIESITTAEPAAWHKDHNVALLSEQVTIGFVPDDTFEGEGVKVSRVVEDTPAEDMGLKAADVIVGGGHMPIADMDGLLEFKSTLKRGDPFELTVRRGEGTTILDGEIPAPESYYIFKRDVPSGLVKAVCMGNRIEIESSRVGTLTLFINPDMINLDEALSITWNGRLVHEENVKPDLSCLIRNFIATRDRKAIYVASITLESPDQ
jgi:dienelactone hydrolase